MKKNAIVTITLVIIIILLCACCSITATYFFSNRTWKVAPDVAYNGRIAYTLNLGTDYVDKNISNANAQMDTVYFLEDGFIWYDVKDSKEFAEKLLNNDFAEHSTLNKKMEKTPCSSIAYNDNRFSTSYSPDDICLEGINFPYSNYIHIFVNLNKVEQRYYEIRE
jgi:hypothetical protein